MKKEVKGMEEKNDLKKDRKVKEELEANKKKKQTKSLRKNQGDQQLSYEIEKQRKK